MEDIVQAGRAAALWAGLSVLLLFALSLLVVRQRQKQHVSIGDGGVPALIGAIRAFGNAAEYVPAGVAALAVLAVVAAPPAAIHGIGAALFLGRVAHAVGLSLTTGVSPGRAIGMVLTWLALLVAGVMLVFYSIA
jgi:uncharacterized protein